MSDDTSEVDLQAILARLNANADDEPDDTEGDTRMSELLKENLIDPENSNPESHTNDDEKAEEQKIPDTEQIKGEINIDSHTNHIQSENIHQNEQPTVLQNENLHEKTKNQQVSEETLRKEEHEEVKKKASATPEDLGKNDESSKVEEPAANEESSRKSSLPQSARKDSANSADDSDLLERIQKLKNQILTVREDAEDDGGQEMLTEQTKNIQMVVLLKIL